MGALGFARAADTKPLATNTVILGKPGTLEILTPSDWTLTKTNLVLPDNVPVFELHSPSDAMVIRLFVRWDDFGGRSIKPTESQMGQIVSNNIAFQYLTNSVEKKIDLEKLRGPAVTGIFARITDAHWTPAVKEQTYPNLAEGMFRCGNIWGNFNLLTHDKDGLEFKAGLKVLESMRRQ